MFRSIIVFFVACFLFPKNGFLQPIPVDSVPKTLIDNVDNWFQNESIDVLIDSLLYLSDATSKIYGNKHAASAYLLHKIGVGYYFSAQDELAIEYFERAKNIREEIYKQTLNPNLLIDIFWYYPNMCGAQYWINKPFASIDYGNQGLHFYSQLPPGKKNAYGLQLLYLHMARSYQKIGDLDNSIINFNAAIEIRKTGNFSSEQMQDITVETIRALQDLGSLFTIDLDNPTLGKKQFELADSLLTIYSETNSNLQILQRENKFGLGTVYIQKKDYHKAIEFTNQALKLNLELNDTNSLIRNYNNLSVCYKKIGNLDTAEEYLRTVKELIETQPGNQYLDFVFDNLSDISFLRGDLQLSLEQDNQAIALMTPDHSELRSNSLPKDIFIIDKNSLLSSIVSRAETETELYKNTPHLEHALNSYLLAANLIDLIRLDYQPDASKVQLANFTKPIFAAAINVCWELYEQSHLSYYAEQALLFSEKSRAIILYDAIRHLDATFGLPEELAKREQAFHIRANYAEKQLALASIMEKRSPELEAKLREDLIDARRRLRNLRDSIGNKYSGYNEYLKQIIRLDYNELINNLAPEVKYLEYFSDNQTVYAFILERKKDLIFERISVPKGLKHWIGNLLQGMNEPGFDFYNPAFNIYESIFAPIESHLDRKRLIIIPDGNLSYLSFEMLPLKLPTNKANFSYREFKDYIFYNYIINYQYSILLKGRNPRENNTEDYQFLGIAPKNDTPVAIRGITFEELTKNQELIQKLQLKIYRSSSILVTKGNVKEQFLIHAQQSKVIQLAAHARANNTNGDLSFILLGDDENSILYAKDLYGQKIPAELIVLSSCQGGGGELEDGEGVISIARGFFYAGCQAVIPTMWVVDETATNLISENFHHALASGVDKSTALHQAKMDYLVNLPQKESHMAHPYYWASFIAIGDMTPINIEATQFPFLRWLIILILGVSMFIAIKMNYIKLNKD